jgi:hypothetical protein
LNMADPVPVVDLKGIGPALAVRLNELGVFTSSDLLRIERRGLADSIEGASLADVRRWQAVSQLLEIDGISLQLAELLFERQVEALDEFSNKRLSEVRSLFQAARAEDLIDTIPADDDIAAWQKDAIRLLRGGVLNGTALGRGGAPLQQVQIRCDGREAVSDARGRFRITRLRLGVPLMVSLSHANYAALSKLTARIVPLGAVVGERFRLQGQPAQERVLSELRGDVLPPLGSAPVGIQAQATAPEPGDVLQVFEFYANGDAKAASRFLSYGAGRFTVTSYRIPTAALPNACRLGDDLVQDAGRWKRTRVTPKDIARRRRLLTERRNWRGEPTNDAELAERLRGILNALSDRK